MVVYPRWRGELISDIQHCGAKRGLSPLARGTHRHHNRWNNQLGLSPLARGTPIVYIVAGLIFRFIPAGAGNSQMNPSRWTSCAVYPRWRGELTKHNLLLIIDFLSQSQSTNLTETHKQHIHYVKEHLIHWLKSQIFKVILYRLKSTKLRRNNFHSNEKLTPQNL